MVRPKTVGENSTCDLAEYLKKYSYERTAQTKGLFKHHTRDITFTLLVDDFGIKYTNQGNTGHLINTVQDNYTFKVDWEAKQYIGIHLNWDYKNANCAHQWRGV